MKFELEHFCKGLHGLSAQEIYRLTDGQAKQLELQEKQQDRQGRADGAIVKYDYRGNIESLGRLLRYVIHGGVPAGMTPTEDELFRDVLTKMKRPTGSTKDTVD